MMLAFCTLSAQVAGQTIRPTHSPISLIFERRIPFEHGKAGLLCP